MGRFRAGQTRPEGSGRKAGTPNKSTLAIREKLEVYGIDIVAQLSEILPQLPIEKRAGVLLELMDFVYPKRKSVEIKDPDPNYDPSQEKTVITFVPTPKDCVRCNANGEFND